MINTLNDFKLLESEELKNSIAEFLFKLYCKLPEQFKESALPTTESEDFVEVVIPTRSQVMMEDLVDPGEEGRASYPLCLEDEVRQASQGCGLFHTGGGQHVHRPSGQ